MPLTQIDGDIPAMLDIPVPTDPNDLDGTIFRTRDDIFVYDSESYPGTWPTYQNEPLRLIGYAPDDFQDGSKGVWKWVNPPRIYGIRPAVPEEAKNPTNIHRQLRTTPAVHP